MEPALQDQAESAPAPLFGTFGVRMSAFAFDGTIVACAFAMTIVLVIITNTASSGRIAVALFIAEFVLYEPVMVAFFGGTLGHRKYNLRVVDDTTGGNPGFGRSALRFILKTVLGIASFASMFLTRRHQAVHDRLTRTTVQVRDLSRIEATAFTLERAPNEPVVQTSVVRRVFVVAVYLGFLYVGLSIAAYLVVSDQCLNSQGCTGLENVVFAAMGIAWLAASIWSVAAGWQGKLPGARARARVD